MSTKQFFDAKVEQLEKIAPTRQLDQICTPDQFRALVLDAIDINEVLDSAGFIGALDELVAGLENIYYGLTDFKLSPCQVFFGQVCMDAIESMNHES